MSVCRAARDLTYCEPHSCYKYKKVRYSRIRVQIRRQTRNRNVMENCTIYFWLYECEYFIDSRVSPKEENVGLCVAFYNSNSTGFRVMILWFTFLSIFQFNRNVLYVLYDVFLFFWFCFMFPLCPKLVSILNVQYKHGANSHQLFQYLLVL